MLQNGFSIAGLWKARGQLNERRPIAIIDIGSNSVRQVVYEGLTRSPSILFNEKVLCGLGKGVALNNKLEDKASKRAIMAVSRFISLGRQLKVKETHVLATAAVREAENGSQFINEIERICGCSMRVLSGEDEANFAAFGVRSGFYNPSGMVGDLGPISSAGSRSFASDRYKTVPGNSTSRLSSATTFQTRNVS